MKGVGPRIFLMVFLTCAFFTNSWLTTNDASRFSLSVAVTHGRLDIGGVLPLVISPGWKIKDFARVGDRVYSDKAPLGSFIGAPVVKLLTRFTRRMDAVIYFTSLLTSGLLTALTAWMLFAFGERFTEDVWPRALTALAYGLGSMALVYGKVFFSSSLTAFLVLAAAISLRVDDPQPGRPLLAGLCLAAAVASDYYAALAILPLAPFALRRRSAAAPFLLGILIGAVPLLIYHYLLFGNPLETPYHYSNLAKSFHSKGFYGLTAPDAAGLRNMAHILFSRNGFFMGNLPVIAAIALWPRLWATRKPAAALTAALFVCYCFMNTSLGWIDAYSARFFMPVLPLLFLPLFMLRGGLQREMIFMAALVVVSAAVTFIGADGALPDAMWLVEPGRQNIVGLQLAARGIHPGYVTLLCLAPVYCLIWLPGAFVKSKEERDGLSWDA